MKLIIVSNRLPVSLDTTKAQPRLERGFGGVALGLANYLEKNRKKMDYLWIGWPGAPVAQHNHAKLSHELSKQKLSPVFLSTEEQQNFYNGFSNDCLWPLFHSFPNMASYKQEYWKGYREVNELFADAVVKNFRPGDIVWIHDYHLMLLPKILRDRLGPSAAIGFFLHIPFPPFEIFRLLPDKWRRGLLLGLLGADVVGFHTYDYDLYFNSCVQRILGYESNMQQIFKENSVSKTDTFPMGIDFNKFHEAALRPDVQKETKILKAATGKFKVVLSVDRLDYTKGILKRLKAFSAFLEKNKTWQKKLVLMMVVVPSRTEVPAYQEMKTQIDSLVGEINGKFGTVNWAPIIYQYKSLNFEQMAAMYGISDVALVTPLRDGMNLVAKEYVASRRNRTGVLILSEMAGAAAELGEAIIVNPNHEEAIVEALTLALKMPLQKQKIANTFMQERLKRYDVNRWAEDFIFTLVSFKSANEKVKQGLPLTELLKAKIVKSFKAAKKRLLFLDYDGTLVPYASHPMLASPTIELKRILQKLGKIPSLEIVLISGRDKTTLGKWFKSFSGSLVGEHGIWIKKRNAPWVMIKPLKNEWKNVILPVLKTYADRLPGAFVEEKEYSVVWHYRLANPLHAQLRMKELTAQLMGMTGNMNVQVTAGKKNIEVRPTEADKGSAAQIFLGRKNYDFVLGIGDDTTDEDLFKALPPESLSIKVGQNPSAAKFSVETSRDVLSLLGQLG